MPRGAARLLMNTHDREMLLEGPAGSGKTRPIMELFHLLALRYPGFRALFTRKVGATLATTCLVTFRRWVLQPQDGVRFFGGSKSEPSAFQYPNGSEIVVGGLDVGADGKQSKILSSEYDAIFVNEATELSLEDWETLTTRLRPFVLTHPRIIGDCNPSHSAHWLNKRCEEGKTRRFRSRLEDNPLYFREDGELTPAGETYLAGLDALTGSRYERLRLGLWVGVENALFPHFDRKLHVRPLEEGLRFSHGAIGSDYGRRHKAAAVPVRVDQFGRRWVFEAWGQPDVEHGRMTEREIGRMRQQYQIRRVRVGPDMDIMVGVLGAEESGIAEGARRARANEVAFLLNVFPGGVVPTSREDAYNKPPAMVTATGDSPGILFVEGGPGIDELCDEMEGYHEVRVANDRKDELVIARINDDRVSALEYACEELQTAPPDYSKPLQNRPIEVNRR